MEFVFYFYFVSVIFPLLLFLFGQFGYKGREMVSKGDILIDVSEIRKWEVRMS